MSMERGRLGSRDSVMVASPMKTQTAAIAASSQNSPCHPVVSTRRPPISGPAAAPTAEAPPQMDTALSCACPLLATDSRLRPQASNVAPAAPWIIRPR